MAKGEEGWNTRRPPGPSCFPVLFALAFASALRAACLGAELWLDEIWSLALAQRAGSLPGVLSLRHDNNHPLNSLYLLAVPDGAALPCYRLHSLVAGLALVVAGWRVAARFGGAAAAVTAWLLAGSYWLVLASTEARGYALALVFALAAFEALAVYLDGGSWRALAVFQAASVLGFLSHLTFALAYLAFVVWSLRRFAARRARPGDELRELAICHGGPAVFFVAYYFLALRGMEVGGGPPVGVGAVVWRLLCRGVGAPTEAWWAPGAVLVVAALAAYGLRLAARRGDVWVFFAAAVLVAPALFLARRPPVLYERYLFVPFVFLLVLLGVALGGMWDTRRRAARAGAVLLLAAFLVGNALEVADYVRTGRGRFQEALGHVAANSDGPITLAGDVDIDRDFRARTYLDFYAPRLVDGEVIYRQDGPVEWIILHRLEPWLDGRPAPGAELNWRGATYRLDWSSPPDGLAWGWYVYRRAR